MDSAEIVYATVDEIIGKTGKSPPWSHTLNVQAPEEVLHKLRLALLALKTEPSLETWRDPSERAMFSLSSSPNVRPEDSADHWALHLIFIKDMQAAEISYPPTGTEPRRLDGRNRLVWLFYSTLNRFLSTLSLFLYLILIRDAAKL